MMGVRGAGWGVGWPDYRGIPDTPNNNPVTTPCGIFRDFKLGHHQRICDLDGQGTGWNSASSTQEGVVRCEEYVSSKALRASKVERVQAAQGAA